METLAATYVVQIVDQVATVALAADSVSTGDLEATSILAPKLTVVAIYASMAIRVTMAMALIMAAAILVMAMAIIVVATILLTVVAIIMAATILVTGDIMGATTETIATMAMAMVVAVDMKKSVIHLLRGDHSHLVVE